MTDDTFGALGVWLTRRLTPLDEVIDVAAAAERLGYGAYWVAGGALPDIFDDIRVVLEATSTIPVGTSIINMYTKTPEEVTKEFWALEEDFPSRFFLGAGPSHASVVEQSNPGEYLPPLVKSRLYLDGLDAQERPVPVNRRLMPALGPLSLKVASKRTLGSIPYNMPVAHTRFAREALGTGPVLAPELAIVLSDDPQLARDRAREFLAPYLAQPNYTGIFLRHGFEAIDLEGGGSERLLTGLFGLGSIEAIGHRIGEHLAAGANHVAVQVLPTEGQSRVDVLTAVALERGLVARVC